MAAKRYTDEEFAEAVRASTSIAQLLKRLGLQASGGNYANARRTLQRLGLDASHFTGAGWNAGQRLKDWSGYTRATNLKPHLLAERGARCEACRRKTWMGRTIPLEIHHVDGNRTHNDIHNLRLLCPNCHALTDNWRNRKA